MTVQNLTSQWTLAMVRKHTIFRTKFNLIHSPHRKRQRMILMKQEDWKDQVMRFLQQHI